MNKERDSLIFYRSFYEAIKELELDKQWEIYNAIFGYWLNFEEPNLTWISKTVFTLIKPQLDANIKKYNNWNKPKQKQKISKTEAKDKQKINKTEGNDNDNDNDNESKELIIINNNNIFKTIDNETLLNKYDITKEQLQEELENFTNYWKAIVRTWKKADIWKELWDIQKTFEPNRRFSTWLSNNKKWNKKPESDVLYTNVDFI